VCCALAASDFLIVAKPKDECALRRKPCACVAEVWQRQHMARHLTPAARLVIYSAAANLIIMSRMTEYPAKQRHQRQQNITGHLQHTL
jgi:hypothetical protein